MQDKKNYERNRTRKNQVLIRFSDDELKRLDEWSAAAKMSRSKYVRQLVAGFQPVEFPPIEYEKIISELEHIGNNMNQLAAKAHTLGFSDEALIRRYDGRF